MDDELLKLECLRHAKSEGLEGTDALKRGQEIFDWTKGRGQGQGLTHRIVTENQHVKVLGRVEDGIPVPDPLVTKNNPFKDYLKSDPDKGAD